MGSANRNMKQFRTQDFYLERTSPKHNLWPLNYDLADKDSFIWAVDICPVGKLHAWLVKKSLNASPFSLKLDLAQFNHMSQLWSQVHGHRHVLYARHMLQHTFTHCSAVCVLPRVDYTWCKSMRQNTIDLVFKQGSVAGMCKSVYHNIIQIFDCFGLSQEQYAYSSRLTVV